MPQLVLMAHNVSRCLSKGTRYSVLQRGRGRFTWIGGRDKVCSTVWILVVFLLNENVSVA